MLFFLLTKKELPQKGQLFFRFMFDSFLKMSLLREENKYKTAELSGQGWNQPMPSLQTYLVEIAAHSYV